MSTSEPENLGKHTPDQGHNERTFDRWVIGFAAILAAAAIGGAASDPSGDAEYYGGLTCSDWHPKQVGAGAPVDQLSEDFIARDPSLNMQSKSALGVLIMDHSENLYSFTTDASGLIPITAVDSIQMPTSCN